MHGRVTEGGLPLKINITSTVPVVCSRGHDCKVQVQLVHDTTEIFLTRCSVSLRNRSSTHTVEVHAKRDSIDDGNKIVTIKIAVVNDSNAMDWQNYLAIDDLKVRRSFDKVWLQMIKAFIYIVKHFTIRLLKIHIQINVVRGIGSVCCSASAFLITKNAVDF